MLISCSKKAEEQTRKAVDKAQAFLSSSKCQEAINVLEEGGLQTENPIYVQVYASAYACRSGFSVLTFFGTDIPLIDTDDSQAFFKSLTLLSSSSETTADSSSYSDLLRAINISISSGGGNAPSQVSRNTMYGPGKAGDIGTQALYMLIAQLGKYLHLYGNVDSSGVKGGGAGSSQCFVQYDDPTAAAGVGSLPGSNACDPGDAGHAGLSLAAGSLVTTKRRMCEGLMIVTNLSDILRNIVLPENDSIGDLSDVQSLIDTYIDDFSSSPDPDYVTLINTTKQSECESFVSTPAKFAKLQQMYVLLFEANLE
jgi:hypothetical protein